MNASSPERDDDPGSNREWDDPPGVGEESRGGVLDAVDPGEAAVGVLVGLAGVLFLLQPVVPRLGTETIWVRPFVLSGGVFAAGLGLGAVVYHRRDRRLRALGHGGMGVGWGLVTLGVVTGVGLFFVGGVVAVAATAFFLVARSRRR
jgi:hypothetical protein